MSVNDNSREWCGDWQVDWTGEIRLRIQNLTPQTWPILNNPKSQIGNIFDASSPLMIAAGKFLQTNFPDNLRNSGLIFELEFLKASSKARTYDFKFDGMKSIIYRLSLIIEEHP